MLATFEAAARSGSFKAAASELNVTTGAVSHQVKALEKELGAPLFERGHRSVELTENGQRLFAALVEGFSTISQSWGSLEREHGGQMVMIGATTAVSSLWLTPKLGNFWQAHGDIMISQEVRDRPFSRPLRPDLIIEYVLEPPKEPNALLFHDELLPIAGPGFFPNAPESLEELASMPLIHLDAAETNWTSWQNWFAALGYTGPIRSVQRVNNYSIALQIARDGGGIVLGWHNLVAPLIERNALVPMSKFHSPAPGAFYLVSGRDENNEAARAFKGWLLENIQMN